MVPLVDSELLATGDVVECDEDIQEPRLVWTV